MNSDRTNQFLRAAPVNAIALLFGVVLIFFGFVLMVAQFFDFSLSQYTWPLFVILPGAALAAWGLSTSRGAGQGLTIFGSVVLTVGLLLSYQNLTDHFESWAYAWALVAPTSVGVAQFAYGLLHHRDALVKRGLRLVLIGVIIFMVGAVFFELIIGISGSGLGVYGLAMLFVLAGGALIGAALLADRGVTPTKLFAELGLADNKPAASDGDVAQAAADVPSMQHPAVVETGAAMRVPPEGIAPEQPVPEKSVSEAPLPDQVPQG